MKNKTIANLLLSSVGILFFVYFFDFEEKYVLSQIIASFAGIGFVVFGIMAGVRLHKLKDHKMKWVEVKEVEEIEEN